MRALAALATIAALVVLVAACGGDDSGVDTDTPVSAYPSPGTPTASPRTQISLRGVPADRLGEITVTGSRSGVHEGRVEAHSDGEGGSFVLEEPLRPGERVTVATELEVRGGQEGDYTFTVSRPAPDGKPFPRPEVEPKPGDVLSFRSEPDLHPPNLRVRTPAGDGVEGMLITGPKTGPGQDGPMITDERGDLVWFRSLPDGVAAADVRVQEYQGEPALTWWEGKVVMPGYGIGEFVIADSAYRDAKRIRAGNGLTGDLHDFLLTERDTALVMSYAPVRWDLSGIGGERDGVVLDNVLQEIDIDTGLVLFEWHSIGNVDFEESHSPVEDANGAYDYFHVNSIDEAPNGDLVISARNTWASYRISRELGRIVWRLGGRRSDFEMGEGTRTAWQHDTVMHDDDRVSIFDNGSSPQEHEQSRGVVIDLDTEAMRATLAQAFTHDPELVADNQGNLQLLPDGGAVAGFGPTGVVTEFGPDGEQRFDAQFPRAVDTYRAYRQPWQGRPQTQPAAAAERGQGGSVEVFASWNGATGVARWEVLAGPSADALSAVGSADRDGFETRIEVQTGEPFVAVRALDADGEELAVSESVPVAGG